MSTDPEVEDFCSWPVQQCQLSNKIADLNAQIKNLGNMIHERGNQLAEAHQEIKRLQERLQHQLPGNLHWLSEDPEEPLECWSTPVDERWENAGTVFELMTAQSLPHIFVTEKVITVDDHGDPDETEAVWLHTRKEAEGFYERSLAVARAEQSFKDLKGDA